MCLRDMTDCNSDSSRLALVKTYMPVSVCFMKRDRRPHHQDKRRGPRMVNFIFKGQRRPIVHFRPYSGQSCLKIVYRKQHRQLCRRKPMPQAPIILREFMTPHDLIHPQTIILLPLYHHLSRHQLPIKTSSLICHRDTTTLPAIQRHLGHHKAGMALIWTQDQRYIACLLCGLGANRCF